VKKTHALALVQTFDAIHVSKYIIWLQGDASLIILQDNRFLPGAWVGAQCQRRRHWRPRMERE